VTPGVSAARPGAGTVPAGDRYRQAAWTYFGYGLVYLAVAAYLQLAVFTVRGPLLLWFGAGAVLTVGVPWLLARPRPWFERWVLSRRDLVRLLALLVFVRTIAIVRIAVQGADPTRMPGFGAGVPTSTAGAWLMALIALATAVMLARAAWSREERA
jgi:hypothetical protein